MTLAEQGRQLEELTDDYKRRIIEKMDRFPDEPTTQEWFVEYEDGFDDPMVVSWAFKELFDEGRLLMLSNGGYQLPVPPRQPGEYPWYKISTVQDWDPDSASSWMAITGTYRPLDVFEPVVGSPSHARRYTVKGVR